MLLTAHVKDPMAVRTRRRVVSSATFTNVINAHARTKDRQTDRQTDRHTDRQTNSPAVESSIKTKTYDQSCACHLFAAHEDCRDDVTNDDATDDRDDDDVMAAFDDVLFCNPQNSHTLSVSMTSYPSARKNEQTEIT